MANTTMMTATKVKGKAMLTFALVYFMFGVQSSSSLELITTLQYIENQTQLVFTEESINGQYLAYALCSDFRNSRCNLVLKTLSSDYSRSCFVSVDNGYVGEGARLIPLSADRIIIVGEFFEHHSDYISGYEHFATLTMDDCKIVEQKRIKGYEAHTYSITPLDGKRYDVVGMARTKTFCKWEYDTEKKSVSNSDVCLPDALLKNEDNIRPLLKNSETAGYVIKIEGSKHWIKVNNKMIVTDNLPVFGGNNVVTSTANNKISICSTDKGRTTCNQYDGSGHDVNYVNIHHDAEFGGGSAVHNLKTDGLVVATGICEDGCFNGYRIPTYYVNKYNGQGKRMRVTIVRDFKCDLKHYNVALKFYDNERGKVCLAMACYGSVAETTPPRDRTWKPKLDVMEKCFD